VLIPTQVKRNIGLQLLSDPDPFFIKVIQVIVLDFVDRKKPNFWINAVPQTESKVKTELLRFEARIVIHVQHLLTGAYLSAVPRKHNDAHLNCVSSQQQSEDRRRDRSNHSIEGVTAFVG